MSILKLGLEVAFPDSAYSRAFHWRVQEKLIELTPCATDLMVGDALTKV